MRKVFLEQNLGKKSKSRFAKKNAKKVVIKLMIEAQKAVSSPQITQPLVISGVSVIDFCDRFNQETQNYESGLPIRAKVIVNSSQKTFDVDLSSPSVYSLMRRAQSQEKYRPSQLGQLIHNISLISLVYQLGSQYYLEEVISFIKQTAGTIRSYDIRYNRLKKWPRINN